MRPPTPGALALRTSEVTYPGAAEYVRQVRQNLRPLLHDCPMADDIILCASELAANAALHSNSRRPGGTFTVRAEISPGRHARIEVEDNGGPWTPRSPTQPATTASI
jgi:anti-sigma regulatory factor (Ser/Thr protein kinase)